jgi:hypothetical protein
LSAYLSVCAIYQNEAEYLREWVVFHRIVGVERFFLYNNKSTDAHLEALEPFLEDGSVVVQDWPTHPGQLPAYDHCLRTHERDSRWIAFIDLDEFLFSPTGKPVSEILVDYERWPAVGPNRRNFGTSGHRVKPEGLVIENYIHASELSDRLNRHTKAVVDPVRTEHVGNAHYFVYRVGHAVDEHRDRLIGGRTETPSFRRLQINHYVMKSEEECLQKFARERSDDGMPRGTPDIQTWEKVHQARETAITMYVDRVRGALDELPRAGGAKRAARKPARSGIR